MIIENRWSWGRQITIAIVLFLGFSMMSMLFYNGTFLEQAVADMVYALLSFAIMLWALKSTKVFVHRLALTKPMIIWGIISLVTLGIVFGFGGVPQHVIMVLQAKHLLVNTLVALSAAIFEESINRGFFLSGFLAYAQYNSRSYKLTRSAIYSSILFGTFHLVNLLGGNSSAVFQQVFWAFVIGVFLAALRFTTNTLFWGMLIHFLLDWFPSASTKFDIQQSNWGIILAVFTPLLVASVIYLVKADQVYQKLPAESVA